MTVAELEQLAHYLAFGYHSHRWPYLGDMRITPEPGGTMYHTYDLGAVQESPLVAGMWYSWPMPGMSPLAEWSLRMERRMSGVDTLLALALMRCSDGRMLSVRRDKTSGYMGMWMFAPGPGGGGLHADYSGGEPEYFDVQTALDAKEPPTAGYGIDGEEAVRRASLVVPGFVVRDLRRQLRPTSRVTWPGKRTAVV